jgi:hypothetical protein
MRIDLAAAAALAAMAFGAPAMAQDLGPTPFPVERGSALPPPAPGSTQTAPPEGRAAAGLDFGAWRSAENAESNRAFQAAIAARAEGKSAAELRADLEANGFACTSEGRLDCRIEIVENGCAFDWYVVREPNRSAPVAGFDRLCLRRP